MAQDTGIVFDPSRDREEMVFRAATLRERLAGVPFGLRRNRSLTVAARTEYEADGTRTRNLRRDRAAL